jgi:hypothetical protein
MQKITFLNNNGVGETAEAYQIVDKYTDNVSSIVAMFPDQDVLVTNIGSGVEIHSHDDGGFRVQRVVASKGDFVYRNSKNLPVVVFPFMLIKDAPRLIKSLWDHSSVGFDTGMEFANKWIKHQKEVQNQKPDFESFFKKVNKKIHNKEETAPAQDSWLAVYEVGECWGESDWGPLEEFLGKSGGTSPIIAITATKHHLKSIDISDYRLSGGKATVKPHDVIIKYNNKFAVIVNAVRSNDDPFVD